MAGKSVVLAVAFVVAIATTIVSAEPAEAFGERPFATMFNANVGVIQRAYERFEDVRSPEQLLRMFREVARAEGRIITWLRAHPPTACQRPWVKVMLSRGTEAQRSWRGAARDFIGLRFDAAVTKVERGARFHVGMVNAANRMVTACP